MQTVFPLKGVLQHYAWGGAQFIPDLLDINNEAKEPVAEWWMGTHPKGPSRVLTAQGWQRLDEWVASNPIAALGKKTAQRFGGKLPFLFKVLDVKKMLSIQVHPNKKMAVQGFYAEEKEGIPIEAPDRNFKDDNHKPELMWALTDFWLLHGFRSEKSINELLDSVPEFAGLRPVFGVDHDMARLYRYVMELPRERVNEILEPLEKRLKISYAKGLLKKDHPDFWAHRAFCDFTLGGNYDRGIFSVYFLNLVNVKPGEVVFQDSGILHAYLEGVNVELMANSDNVLRGGLTPKYVDVAELMKHVSFESVVPKILTPVSINAIRSKVETPAPDFQLSHLVLKKGQQYQRMPNAGPEIYFVLEGNVSTGEGSFFSKGEAFFVPDISSVNMEGEGELFCAGVPVMMV